MFDYIINRDIFSVLLQDPITSILICLVISLICWVRNLLKSMMWLLCMCVFCLLMWVLLYIATCIIVWYIYCPHTCGDAHTIYCITIACIQLSYRLVITSCIALMDQEVAQVPANIHDPSEVNLSLN